MDVNERKNEASPELNADSNGTIPFQSYRQYLSYLQDNNPNYKWLHQFFGADPEVPESHLTVLDCVEGEINSVEYTGCQMLQCPAKNVSTRILMLSYHDRWHIDRRMLDDIAFALDLDPFFLWHHFDDKFSHLDNPFEEDGREFRKGLIAEQIPSGNAFLEFQTKYYDGEKFSALILDPFETFECTTVILCEESGRRAVHFPQEARFSMRAASKIAGLSAARKSSQRYRFELRRWRPDRVYSAEQNHVDFLIPLIRFFLNDHVQEIERLKVTIEDSVDTNLSEFWDEDLDAEEHALFEALMAAQKLEMSMSSFHNFVLRRGKKKSLDVRKIMLDMRSLLGQANQQKKIMRDCVNHRATILALKESKKSIQMAQSVKTLTQLAFIFVPLTFSVSIFGANLQEMGSGTVPLWAFIVTLLAISTSSAFVWGLYSGHIQQHLRGLVGFPTRYSVILQFASRSPFGALILFLYSLSHSGFTMDQELRGLGLIAILRMSQENYKAYEYAYRPAKKGKLLGGAFWKNRLHQVYLFVREDNWQHNYFHRRIISKFKRSKPRKDEGSSQEP